MKIAVHIFVLCIDVVLFFLFSTLLDVFYTSPYFEYNKHNTYIYTHMYMYIHICVCVYIYIKKIGRAHV